MSADGVLPPEPCAPNLSGLDLIFFPDTEREATKTRSLSSPKDIFTVVTIFSFPNDKRTPH
jgi:hypothetical protein